MEFNKKVDRALSDLTKSSQWCDDHFNEGWGNLANCFDDTILLLSAFSSKDKKLIKLNQQRIKMGKISGLPQISLDAILESGGRKILENIVPLGERFLQHQTGGGDHMKDERKEVPGWRDKAGRALDYGTTFSRNPGFLNMVGAGLGEYLKGGDLKGVAEKAGLANLPYEVRIGLETFEGLIPLVEEVAPVLNQFTNYNVSEIINKMKSIIPQVAAAIGWGLLLRKIMGLGGGDQIDEKNKDHKIIDDSVPEAPKPQESGEPTRVMPSNSSDGFANDVSDFGLGSEKQLGLRRESSKKSSNPLVYVAIKKKNSNGTIKKELGILPYSLAKLMND